MRSNRDPFACIVRCQRWTWNGWCSLGMALLLAPFLATLVGDPVAAQIDPAIRDRIIPATVQIVVIGEATVDGVTEPFPFSQGSGTVVSSDGLILTNWHVVDMQSHRAALEDWEDQAAAAGESISLDILDEAVLVLTSDGERPPLPRYFAAVVASDPRLDFAVLQIRAVIENDDIQPASQNLAVPYAVVGNSDRVGLGDPVDIFGFAGVSGGALTYTNGVVSGFVVDEGDGRSWILTDATMSGGSSGGTAVNRAGELIGVPTQGSSLDCRPGDTNNDGRLDAQDVGCIPTGGSIGQMRPVNLALDLLREAGWSPELDGPHIPTPTPTIAITPTSTHTLTPTVSSTPTPTPAALPNRPRLPGSLSLSHSSCFRVENDGVFGWQEIVARLSSAPDPEQYLREWGWQTGVYRTFACDGPPDGDAGWVEINVHRFANAVAAREAVDYFAAARFAGLPLVFADSPSVGDHAAALTGPSSNGKEFTIYASQGPLLIRVTGVSPSGIPFMNVLAVTQDVLALNQSGAQSSTTPTRSVLEQPTLSASAFLPASLAVNYANCFWVVDEGAYSYGDVIAVLQQFGLSQAQADALGWTDGAYKVFRCEDAPIGRATQLEVVIHQWSDASQALAYFSQMNVLGEHESRACESANTYVVCIFGRSATGSPLSDVHFLLNQVIASIS